MTFFILLHLYFSTSSSPKSLDPAHLRETIEQALSSTIRTKFFLAFKSQHHNSLSQLHSGRGLYDGQRFHPMSSKTSHDYHGVPTSESDFDANTTTRIRAPPNYNSRSFTKKPSRKQIDESTRGHCMYSLKLYCYGLLVCGVVEGLMIACLLEISAIDVGIIFSLLFLTTAVFAICYFWNHKWKTRVFAVGVFLAFGAGILGGVLGGGYLKEYWTYGTSNTQLEASPSAKPAWFQGKSVLNFVDRAYVNQKLTGVVYRTPSVTYCAAPVLAKERVPQAEVIYWAVGLNCCSGTSKQNVNANCHHWTDSDLTGEVSLLDSGFYSLAVAKAAEWNDFPADPNSVFVVMMTKAEHEARQSQRFTLALLMFVAVPFLWPSLAVVLYLIRGLAMIMCGVQPVEQFGKSDSHV